jgi:predicted dinucleotide-binding enzyme
MRIAILGGSGKLGLALALRLSKTGHEAAIGSRDAAKAAAAANTVGEPVRGMANIDAASWCETAFISGIALCSSRWWNHSPARSLLMPPLP